MKNKDIVNLPDQELFDKIKRKKSCFKQNDVKSCYFSC